VILRFCPISRNYSGIHPEYLTLIWVRIFEVPTEIRTGLFPITSPKGYGLSQVAPFGLEIWVQYLSYSLFCYIIKRHTYVNNSSTLFSLLNTVYFLQSRQELTQNIIIYSAGYKSTRNDFFQLFWYVGCEMHRGRMKVRTRSHEQEYNGVGNAVWILCVLQTGPFQYFFLRQCS
jgi:hypothetical protein